MQFRIGSRALKAYTRGDWWLHWTAPLPNARSLTYPRTFVRSLLRTGSPAPFTRPARPTQHTPCRMSVAQLCQGRMLGDAPAPGPASRPSTACQSLRLAQNASPSAHDVAMFWTIASLPDD